MSDLGIISEAPYGLVLRNAFDPAASYKTKGVQRSVRLLPADWERVRQAAQKDGLTLAEWLRAAVFAALPANATQPARQPRDHAPMANRTKTPHTNDRIDMTARNDANTGQGKLLTEKRR